MQINQYKNVFRIPIIKPLIFIPLANHKYVGITVKIMGILCLLVSLITMVLWKLHRVDLLFFTATTMFFNTALCFGLAGTALLFLGTPSSTFAKILGWIVVVFASLENAQDLFSVDLKIDQIFADAYYPMPNEIPGRMGLQTSTCFILTGFSIILFAGETLSKIQLIISLVFSSLVAMNSLMVSFGYFLHLVASYSWVVLDPISINTASTFLFLTTGLIFFSILKSLQWHVSIVDYAHYIIFFVVFMSTLLLWRALTNQSYTIIEMMTENRGQDLLYSFEQGLDSSVERFDPLIFRLGGIPENITKKSLDKYADYVFKREKYVEYVGLFTEDFEVVSTHSTHFMPFTPELLKKTFSTQGITMSALFRRDDNQFVYFIIYPVTYPRFNGYLVRGINMKRLIEVTIARIYKNDMFVIIKENNKDIYCSSGGQKPNKTYLTEFMSTKYGKNWTIAVWPTLSFIEKNRSHLPEITLAFGVLFAFFLAYAFRMSLIPAE